MALPACGWSDHEHDEVCPKQAKYFGEVAGTAIEATNYWVQAQFEDVDPDSLNLDPFGTSISVSAWGLESNHEGDIDRWRYLQGAVQLELLFEQSIEYEECSPPEEDPGGIQLGSGPLRRNFGVFLFNLSDHDVQPGDEIDVLDTYALTAELHPNNASRRDTLRALVDEARADDRPYAVVVFAPDRSAECGSWTSLLLADTAHFAQHGTISFDDLMDKDGAPIEHLDYPGEGVAFASFTVEAEFADGEEVLIESECVPFQQPNVYR